MKPPEVVTATRSELDAILALVKPALAPQQYQLLQGVLQTFEFLMLRLQNAKTSLRRLQQLFGAPTERHGATAACPGRNRCGGRCAHGGAAQA